MSQDEKPEYRKEFFKGCHYLCNKKGHQNLVPAWDKVDHKHIAGKNRHTDKACVSLVMNKYIE